MAYKRPNDGLNAVKRYQAKCDSIMIRPMKEEGEKIRASAEAENISITRYIMNAIAFYEENKPKSNPEE